MVVLAWRSIETVDLADPADSPGRDDRIAGDSPAATIDATTPNDALTQDEAGDMSPAIGLVMAVLLSLPLWALLIGAGIYVLG